MTMNSQVSNQYSMTAVSYSRLTPFTATPTKPRKNSAVVSTSFKRSNRSSHRHSSPSHRTPDRPSSFTTATQPYTIESLAAELEQIRSEITEVIAQHAHAEEDYTTTSATLSAELDSLREKRKEEDIARAQMRSENKQLEESKRMLETQKSKVEKSVKQKTDGIDRIKHDLETWEKDVSGRDLRKSEIEQQIVDMENKLAEREKGHRVAVRGMHKVINELEDEIRGLIAKVKKAEMEKDPRSGDINENAFAKLLHSEDAEDTKLESSWKEVQKNLELRYVDVFEQYRDAEEKFRKAQGVLAMLTMQGSMPGTTPVSPEVSKSSKRRNRTRNKSQQPVSSPITSYPLHDPRFPDASTFNNLHFPPSFQNQLADTSSTSLSTTFPFSLQQHQQSLPSLYTDALEDDLLNNSGPISPSVDMLLPSNLFVTDELPPQDLLAHDSVEPATPSTSADLHPFATTSSSEVFDSFGSQQSLVTPNSRPPSQYSSPMAYTGNNSSTSLTGAPSPFFSPLGSSNNAGGSALKNVLGADSESTSISQSDSSDTNISQPQTSLATSLPSLVKTPGRGSKLFSVFNSVSLSPSPASQQQQQQQPQRQSQESDDDALAQQSTNSSVSSTGALTGFSSFTKRSPARKPLFGGVSALGSSIGSIGQSMQSITRKKDSFDSSSSSAGAASLATQLSSSPQQQHLQRPRLGFEPDEFLLNDELRTPGRRFASLFSFSKQRGLNAQSSSSPAANGDDSSEQQQAPIGTRRRSGSYTSSTFEVSSPTYSSAPQLQSQESEQAEETGNNNVNGLSAFGSQVGNLFTGQSPVFARRGGNGGGRSLWDFNGNRGNAQNNISEW